MTKERKQEVINTFKRDEKDTGSSEVQIALLTERINELTGVNLVFKIDINLLFFIIIANQLFNHFNNKWYFINTIFF